MSSIVRFNPKSQVYMGNSRDGRFEPRADTRQGIVSNQDVKPAGPQVLSQTPAGTAAGTKTIE